MNARSRWKIEYLRTKSSSPAGSVVDAIAEALPEQLTKDDGAENNDCSIIQDTPITTTQPILEDTISASAVPAGPTPMEEDTAEEQLSTKAAASVMEITEEPQPEQAPPAEPSVIEGAAVEEAQEKKEKEPEVDPIEQDILLQLEELKKEKSRLFALFRTATSSTAATATAVPIYTTSRGGA
ncbi:hypothetical protein BGW39_011780 [Mortierella sp. 14UC]|nr:hypothetical protein BGW39_011780 [Mortierella sp. 14UC]